jgi:hypothetical protein
LFQEGDLQDITSLSMELWPEMYHVVSCCQKDFPFDCLDLAPLSEADFASKKMKSEVLVGLFGGGARQSF